MLRSSSLLLLIKLLWPRYFDLLIFRSKAHYTVVRPRSTPVLNLVAQAWFAAEFYHAERQTPALGLSDPEAQTRRLKIFLQRELVARFVSVFFSGNIARSFRPSPYLYPSNHMSQSDECKGRATGSRMLFFFWRQCPKLEVSSAAVPMPRLQGVSK